MVAQKKFKNENQLETHMMCERHAVFLLDINQVYKEIFFYTLL